MQKTDDFIHPYIPNSAPANKEKMMNELGIQDIGELYEDIPERLKFKGKMNIPPAIASELELRKHVTGMLLMCPHSIGARLPAVPFAWQAALQAERKCWYQALLRRTGLWSLRIIVSL